MPEHPAPDLDIILVRADDLQPVAWKNGGGVTREIAAHPPGSTFESFLWRISMADVAAEGAFSIFPGIDRVLTVIEGGTMILVDAAEEIRHAVHPFEPFQFPGETPICARLPDGAIRDFNLMYRRGLAQGHTELRRTTQRLVLDAGSMVLHCAGGSYRISTTPAAGTYLLHHGDTLVLNRHTSDTHHINIDIEPHTPGAVLLDSRIRTI